MYEPKALSPIQVLSLYCQGIQTKLSCSFFFVRVLQIVKLTFHPVCIRKKKKKKKPTNMIFKEISWEKKALVGK